MDIQFLRNYAVFRVRNGDTRLVFQGNIVDCLIYEKTMTDLAARASEVLTTWRTEVLRP